MGFDKVQGPSMAYVEAKAVCEAFAERIGATFEESIEMGFIRQVAGFHKDKAFLSYNPESWDTFEEIWEHDEVLDPPEGTNLYGKNPQQFVVMIDDITDQEDAVIQMADWIRKIEESGRDVYIEPFTLSRSHVNYMMGIRDQAIRTR